MKILLIFLFCFFIIIPQVELVDLRDQRLEITVSVDGEVREKGVRTLHRYATIDDLLKQVELMPTADITALSRFTVLKNGDTIIIPKQSEIKRISINQATSEELCMLPGIGTQIASRIIAYRNEHGYFQSLEEITNVEGIGEIKFQRLVDLLCL